MIRQDFKYIYGQELRTHLVKPYVPVAETYFNEDITSKYRKTACSKWIEGDRVTADASKVNCVLCENSIKASIKYLRGKADGKNSERYQI